MTQWQGWRLTGYCRKCSQYHSTDMSSKVYLRFQHLCEKCREITQHITTKAELMNYTNGL